MKTPPDDSARAFEDLVNRARRDEPGPLDTVALLRAVRQAPAVETGWWNDFAALFDTRVVFNACSAGALASFALAGWLAWDAWQHVLPWAQLLSDSSLFS